MLINKPFCVWYGAVTKRRINKDAYIRETNDKGKTVVKVGTSAVVRVQLQVPLLQSNPQVYLELTVC